jgi:hypothetical protein
MTGNEGGEIVIRRPSLLALTLAALATVLFASLAAAAPPTKETFPFSGTFTTPGDGPAICDFTYTQVFSGTDEVTFFSDGRVLVHTKVQVSHTNVGTGYTLTETDSFNITFHADGSQQLVGVFWHLRDASGKLVVVQAGQMVFDPVGNVVKFTPHMNPDFAGVICPALGGNPAP